MQENEGKKKQQMKIITFKATNLKKTNKLKQKPTKNKKDTQKRKKEIPTTQSAPQSASQQKTKNTNEKKKHTQPEVLIYDCV